MANAQLTGRCIGKTFVEHRKECIDNSQNCKYFDDSLDIQNWQKRPQAPKPVFSGLESEKSENWISSFVFFEKYFKIAH